MWVPSSHESKAPAPPGMGPGWGTEAQCAQGPGDQIGQAPQIPPCAAFGGGLRRTELAFPWGFGRDSLRDGEERKQKFLVGRSQG